MTHGVPPLYCAPTAGGFELAHVLTSTSQDHLGMVRTRCGLLTGNPAEGWQPVGLLYGDRVCGTCAPGHPQAAQPAVQGEAR